MLWKTVEDGAKTVSSMMTNLASQIRPTMLSWVTVRKQF